MAVRDGDGWVECSCGNRHWGLNGAAGLLLVREGAILLQHRAPWVHNGDTWGIPGGARDSHEEIFDAAAREGHEECGIEKDLIRPIETYVDDHGDWAYWTVICEADEDVEAHHVNDEALQVEWVPFDQVLLKNLHPSFAASWPALLTLLGELSI
jgi:8-oxo-dGTP diphosphatase